MGYGGILIWTGLARNLKKNYPDKKIIFIYKKYLKSLLLFKKQADHVILENNGDVFLATDKISWFFKKYKFKKNKIIVVDLDDENLRYWGKNSPEKIEFKKEAHAIQIACKPFNVPNPELKPKLNLTPQEKEKISQLLMSSNLQKNKFICIEPHANTAAFTSNKEWFWDRWQELTNRLNKYISDNNLDVKLVQIGATNGRILDGVKDLTGNTSFRESAGIIENSLTLVSYEGGLIHLATAVNKECVVLISGFIPKKLMAYPNNVNFYTDIECQGCGLKVPCPKNRECMDKITIADVFNACIKLIKKYV